MRTILEIYFGLNLFVAGYVYYNESESFNDIKRIVYITIVMLAFGFIMFLIVKASEIIVNIFKYLDTNIQLSFWFLFYLTKTFNNLPEHELRRLSHKSYLKKDSKKLKDKIFNKATEMIKKRNKYIYNYEQDQCNF